MSAAPLRNPILVLATFAVFGALAVAAAGRAPIDVGDDVPPSAPTNVRAASATASAVTVAWDPSTDNVRVAGYYVYGKNKRWRTSGTTLAVTRLSCGSVVDVRIVAYDNARNTSPSAQATIPTAPCTDDEPPTAPAGFTQDATTQDAVVLAWQPATDNAGVVGYGVYRNGLLLRSTPGPTVTLDHLACGSTYQYGVDAFDAAGNHSVQAAAWVRTAACADGSPPSTPTGLTITGADASSISLAWSPSTDDVGVAGYRMVINGTPTSVTQPSATARNLVCGTTYTIGVDAYDAAGNRSPAATVAAATAACASPPPGDVTPPSPPAALGVVSALKTSISLAWSPSTDDVGVTGYGVYRNGTRMATSSSAGATVSQLACGTGYTLEVDAVDAAGNRSTRAATFATTAPCSDTTPPTAPTNVIATSRTPTSIALSWSPSSDDLGVAGYGVYRGGALVGTSTTTTAIVSGLACNTNYTLAVDARDAADNRSAQTVVMVATTACPDTTPPSTPANVTASAVAQTSLTLNWSASSDNVGVTGYDVLRNGAVVASGPGTTSAQQGLACGTSYAFAIVAFDAAGNRSQPGAMSASTAACATPPPPPPSATTLACGSSLDAAYDAAAPGAVVQLADCSYTGKTITGSKASPGVVFDLAGSNQGSIGLSGAQNVELRNGRGSASLGCQPGRIVLRNYSQTGIFWNGVCNVSWIGGELGPQSSDQINWIYSDSGFGSHDIVLDGLFVHDNKCVSSGCHYEAIRIDRGVDGIVIRNSVFKRDAIFHIFVTSLNGSNLSRNITIERNCFDQPDGGSSVVATHDPIVTSVDPALLRIRVLNNFAETGSNFRGPFYESTGNTFGSASTCDTWIPGRSTS